MTSQTHSRGEVSALGESIYREKIRSLVEPQEHGKFVVIDVETGDYELEKHHANDATATKRLIEAVEKHGRGCHDKPRSGGRKP